MGMFCSAKYRAEQVLSTDAHFGVFGHEMSVRRTKKLA